jgi:hypothetical protein
MLPHAPVSNALRFEIETAKGAEANATPECTNLSKNQAA